MYGACLNRPPSSVRQTRAKLATASPSLSVDNFVLPPNVNGRARGTLAVRFGNFSDSTDGSQEQEHTLSPTPGLRWNSTKVYVSVDLQLVWWGQQSSIAPAILHWEQGSTKRQYEGTSVQYEVRTSAELFRRYLKSCEPIRVRLVSKRTQSLIGTAKVQIPGPIINFRETCPQTTAQARGEVLSVRGFRLGELSLELTLSLDPKEVRPASTSATASKAKQSQQPVGKENNKMLCVEQPQPLGGLPTVLQPTNTMLSVEGKPAPLHESSQRSQQAAAKKKQFRTLDVGSRQKILDYLTGKPLDDDEATAGHSELSTLSDIRSISPAESLLEALARYDRAPQPRKQTYLHAVDCVRVLVQNLKLTRAGQKEIQHRAAALRRCDVSEPAFAVKMKLSRNPTTTTTTTTTKLKFLSTAIDSDGAEVSFDAHPQTTRLSLANDDEGLYFDFGVHLIVGSFHKTRSFYLGSAMVRVRELLEGHFCCHKRCPVRLASDDILLGTLTVHLELGSRGLHFGPELIDAVLVDKGNVTLDSSSSSSETLTPDGEIYHHPAPPFGWKMVRRPHGSCSHHSAPVDGHCYGGHRLLFDRRECASHTGCPAVDNQSPPPPAKEGRDDHSSTKPQQSSAGETFSTAGNSNQQPTGNEQHHDRSNDRDPPKAMETDASPPDGCDHPKLLHGLLHLGQLKHESSGEDSLPSSDHFLVCYPFWTDEPSTLTSELCSAGGDFNYLRTFPVLPNQRFIERVRNQHMLVELWQKPPSTAGGEKLVGVTRLPLHQFYIAFRDAQLSEHLSHAKLPVISIDGWSGIGSPLAAEPCGQQLHAVLAIGTESQIEHFKLSRQLLHTSGDAPRTPRVVSLPAPAPPRSNSNNNDDDSPPRLIFPRADHKSIQTMGNGAGGGGCGGIGGCAKPTPTLEVANMLSAFIENLAQRLPISSERSTAPASYDSNRIITSTAGGSGGSQGLLSSTGSPHSQANRPQLRKTADLLDNLQKALAQRPSASALDGMGLGGCAASLLGVASTPADQTPPAATGPTAGHSHACITPEKASTNEGGTPGVVSVDKSLGENRTGDDPPVDECKVFRVAIEVEQAVNLPKLTISKKYAKRHKNRNVPEALELEPSAYATFEGYNLKPGLPNTVKSHEGIVYTTHVLERNCAPGWQKRFDVQLPVDLMLNDEKRFILKVWRKAALSDAPKCRLLPAPMEDAVIGFCAIDLSVLLSGMPYILGWYAIMDFSGRCNGQIKVNIHPLEDVQVYKTLDVQQHHQQHSQHQQHNFQVPLSIDVDCGGGGGGGGGMMGLGGDVAANSSLSRALKRKFTELEEITERLKARLFDVTGTDESLDLDDQFERDLNTAADERDDEEDDDDDDDYNDDGDADGGGGGGLPDPHGDMSNQKRNSQYPNGALTLTTNTSSYSMCASGGGGRGTESRNLTGCSTSTDSHMSTKQRSSGGGTQQLAELLQTHDLDTLINPALLKNLLNASTSDSTPPLGLAPDADMTDESSSLSLSCRSSLPVDTPQGEAGSTTATVGGDRVKQISSALQRTTISEAGGSGPSNKCREAPEGEPMAKEGNK